MGSEYTNTKNFAVAMAFGIVFIILCVLVVIFTVVVAGAYDNYGSGGFIAGIAAGSAGTGLSIVIVILNGVGKVQAPKDPKLYLGLGIATAVMLMAGFGALVYGLIMVADGIPVDVDLMMVHGMPEAEIALAMHIATLACLGAISGLLWIVIVAAVKNIGIGSRYIKEHPVTGSAAARAAPAQASSSSGTQFCSSCGEAITSDSKFCKKCGKPVS